MLQLVETLMRLGSVMAVGVMMAVALMVEFVVMIAVVVGVQDHYLKHDYAACRRTPYGGRREILSTVGTE